MFCLLRCASRLFISRSKCRPVCCSPIFCPSPYVFMILYGFVCPFSVCSLTRLSIFSFLCHLCFGTFFSLSAVLVDVLFVSLYVILSVNPSLSVWCWCYRIHHLPGMDVFWKDISHTFRNLKTKCIRLCPCIPAVVEIYILNKTPLVYISSQPSPVWQRVTDWLNYTLRSPTNEDKHYTCVDVNEVNICMYFTTFLPICVSMFQVGYMTELIKYLILVDSFLKILVETSFTSS